MAEKGKLRRRRRRQKQQQQLQKRRRWWRWRLRQCIERNKCALAHIQMHNLQCLLCECDFFCEFESKTKMHMIRYFERVQSTHVHLLTDNETTTAPMFAHFANNFNQDLYTQMNQIHINHKIKKKNRHNTRKVFNFLHSLRQSITDDILFCCYMLASHSYKSKHCTYNLNWVKKNDLFSFISITFDHISICLFCFVLFLCHAVFIIIQSFRWLVFNPTEVYGHTTFKQM